MRTRFVNRFGEAMDIELTTYDCCPECCGGLERTKPQDADHSPLRCNSCGMVFEPATDEQKGTGNN